MTLVLPPHLREDYRKRMREAELKELMANAPKYFSGFYYGVDALGQVGKRYMHDANTPG